MMWAIYLKTLKRAVGRLSSVNHVFVGTMKIPVEAEHANPRFCAKCGFDMGRAAREYWRDCKPLCGRCRPIYNDARMKIEYDLK